MEQKRLKREIGLLKRRIQASQKRYRNQLKRYLESHLGTTTDSFQSNIPDHIAAMQQELAVLESHLQAPDKHGKK